MWDGQRAEEFTKNVAILLTPIEEDTDCITAASETQQTRDLLLVSLYAVLSVLSTC